MEFLFIIIFLILASCGTYFLMQRFVLSKMSYIQESNFILFRVRGTARGATGRYETSAMLEQRREKVNKIGSRF